MPAFYLHSLLIVDCFVGSLTRCLFQCIIRFTSTAFVLGNDETGDNEMKNAITTQKSAAAFYADARKAKITYRTVDAAISSQKQGALLAKFARQMMGLE